MDAIKGLTPEEKVELLSIAATEDRLFTAGQSGVEGIYTLADKKAEFVELAQGTLCCVKSALGHPAYYPFLPARFEGPPLAVLMDLDGTSVHSESFWVYIIERTMSRLTGDSGFSIGEEHQPFVSGHSVSEHLQYCIDTFCPGHTVEEARGLYYEVTRFEMGEIMAGRGQAGAFAPAPYLKDFLTALKALGIKIGLVTSGLYEKAMPEIVSAFRTLDMGDPLDFYDVIITAGQALIKGQAGTLGELTPKPHPWLYAECARVGLGIPPEQRHRIIGLEDSAAGVLSLRLAGFSCLGVEGGNIRAGGAACLCGQVVPGLLEALAWINDGEEAAYAL